MPQPPCVCKWCYTWNNYPEGTPLSYFDEISKQNFSQYENAPTTGTPHIQGYFHLKEKKRLTQLAKMFPGIHFEQARASAWHNYQYCQKGETRTPGTEPHLFGPEPKEDDVDKKCLCSDISQPSYCGRL